MRRMAVHDMSTRRRQLEYQRSGGFRQSEDVQITANDGGSYKLQVEGREHPYEGVGGTWQDADNAVGEDVRVAFVQGYPTLPIMFSRGSKPNSRIVIDGDGGTFHTNWERFCRNFNGRGNMPELETGSADRAVSFEGEVTAQTPAGILRTYGTRTIWTSGSVLHDLDESDGTKVETDMTDEIVAMVAPGGTTLCLVEGVVDPNADCTAAYNAAFNLASFHSAPFQFGRDSCVLGDPETAQEGYDNFGISGFDGANPAPPPYNDGGELETCWFDGLFAGWFVGFNEGREFEGCDPEDPEE